MWFNNSGGTVPYSENIFNKVTLKTNQDLKFIYCAKIQNLKS